MDIFHGESYEEYDVPIPFNRWIMMSYVPLVLLLQCIYIPRLRGIRMLWYVFNVCLASYSLYVFAASTDVVLYGAGITHAFNKDSKDIIGTFLVSKYVELLDTFFIIFSRKQIGFLHVYHHIVTLIFTRMNFLSMIHASIFFVWMNSLVHTIMYAYYAATCLGLRFKYKYCITILQIVQMFGGLGVLYLNYHDPTEQQQGVVKLGLGMYLSYAVLFIRFFINTYVLL